MLLVDDRVGSADLVVPLRRMGLTVRAVRLPFADIAFQGRGVGGDPVEVGIEFKNMGDLCGSLRSGRLAGHQNPGLGAAYDVRWLVVEGVYEVDSAGIIMLPRQGRMRAAHARITLDEVEGRLLTLSVATGLHIRHTVYRWQTLRFIARLYRWWADGVDAHTSHVVVHTPPTVAPMSRFRQMFMPVVGLGARATLAAEVAFGSPQRACNASEAEWAALVVSKDGKRLGHKTAQAVVAFIREGL